MYRLTTLLVALLSAARSTHAFVVVVTTRHTQSSTTTTQLHDVKNNSYLNDLSAQNPDMGSEPKANPARPELPVVPGDYDWDAKFANDADWVSDPNNIPGKQVVSEAQLAAQATALAALEEKWRKEQYDEEDAVTANVGWVPKAEIINGRTAMFFLVTGLLTEYWTGVTLPGQVEEMLRVGGVIGFE